MQSPNLAKSLNKAFCSKDNNMALSLIQICSLAGLFLSVYSLHIEKRFAESKEYRAVCDISNRISCTKLFSSRYGTHFGISNSLYGLLFYLILFILSLYNLNNYLFYLSVILFIGSLYLAYVSYFKLKNYCIICHGIYLVNILILVFSYRQVF